MIELMILGGALFFYLDRLEWWMEQHGLGWAVTVASAIAPFSLPLLSGVLLVAILLVRRAANRYDEVSE